ncbi:paramyosin-like isoform X1 [Mytilus trossulus]|uniref:paramyosin-like isoform X1 n=1 Tax=Mytilus trossulus TaxID=6551 RepID=UPI003007C552
MADQLWNERSSFWKKLYQGPGNNKQRRSSIPTSHSVPTALNVTEKIGRRPPVQFQSKYPSLPDISPRHMDGQLVPVFKRKASPIIRNNSDMEPEERIRQLEMRVAVSEKSNRALLEEVLRLQGDLKGTTRHNDDMLREEQSARRNIENAITVSNELIQHLGSRIKEAEHKLDDERLALSSLVNHTKGVEQAVKSSQQELVTKKDVQSSRLQDVRTDLDEVLQSKAQLERVTIQMADDIRNLKMRVEQHTNTFATVSTDLKNKSKKLEDDNRLQLDNLRKQSTVQSQTEHQTTQLRGQVETRLSELREVLVDLRAKHDIEITERRNLETTLSQRVHELQQQLNDASRKREESMHTVDMLLREKEHLSAAERMTLTSKVADTVEDVNKKLLSKEIKMREEMQDRYLNLERLIQQEQIQRREYERSTREETDRKWQAIKHAHDDLNIDLKESLKAEKLKSKETITKLDESISIIEKQTLENKRQFEKLMSAEITQRKTNTKNISESLSQMNEKLQIATSTLQQAIGGVTQSFHTMNEKMRREMRQTIAESKDSTTRGMTDLDARISHLKNRMNDNEEKLEARVATASQVLGENLREKVDAITVWQDTTQSSLREIQNSVHKLPDEIYAVQEKQTLLKSEMNSRMTAESDARNREVDALKQEIQQLKARRDPHPATIHDLENVQASVRKLADSIQTVKTVLGMKIQSEQKLRISGLEDLQTQVNQVKVNVGMPRYTSTGMKDDPSDGYDTGFASWDDPTPSHTGNLRATTQEGRKTPVDNAGMGPIPEGNETKRTNSQTSLKNQKNKSPTPSYGRNQTPSEDRNKTPAQNGKQTPSQSRNQTPTGNKTPSQSRNQTPTGNQTNSRNVTPTTGRKSATKKNNTQNDGSGTPVSLSNV